MPAGYVIAQITVTDPVAYKDYVAAVTPIIEKFGGEYLVRGGIAEYFESESVGDRTVVIRFESLQAARNWYHSDEYGPGPGNASTRLHQSSDHRGGCLNYGDTGAVRSTRSIQWKRRKNPSLKGEDI